jgi:hypothetical protein
MPRYASNKVAHFIVLFRLPTALVNPCNTLELTWEAEGASRLCFGVV